MPRRRDPGKEKTGIQISITTRDALEQYKDNPHLTYEDVILKLLNTNRTALFLRDETKKILEKLDKLEPVTQEFNNLLNDLLWCYGLRPDLKLTLYNEFQRLGTKKEGEIDG